ncbi:MAG: hypothetical protein R2710_28385 [Acidimicrobiales bacterium]
MVRDVAVELAISFADDLLGFGQAEGYEEQSGLVDVVVVLVDDVDVSSLVE